MLKKLKLQWTAASLMAKIYQSLSHRVIENQKIRWQQEFTRLTWKSKCLKKNLLLSRKDFQERLKEKEFPHQNSQS